MKIFIQSLFCFACLIFLGCSSSKKEAQTEIRIGGEAVKQADGSTFTPATIEEYESVPKELPGRSQVGTISTTNPKTGLEENTLKPKDKILAAVHGSKGAVFIDRLDIEPNTVHISYDNSVEKVKKSEGEFRGSVEDYWTAGSYWKKHLVILPAQIFISDPAKNKVKIDFPLAGKTYKCNISRSAFEKFTGMSFGKDPEGETNKFYNKFIFDSAKRDQLFKQFVKS